MASNQAKEKVAKVFDQVADAIETGEFGSKTTVGITTLGSEHGVEEIVTGAELAADKYQDVTVKLVGPEVDSELEVISKVDCEEEAHNKMEDLLESGKLDACVTNHYNFPIGVSTVGRVVTPGQGREMLVATSTGTSATNRIPAMIWNGIYGIIAAKALGNERPSVGILNVDGARQVEQALKDLKDNGYPIEFAESMRSDGGCVMRGNDLLTASADVMVTDTLTGNLLLKLFSSFTTGGTYEALGYGYGPGVGEDYDKIINIISRASGAPVIAGAIRYAADAAQGGLPQVAKDELEAAKKAGLEDIIAEQKSQGSSSDDITAPPEKTVTEEISGIDILVLDDAVETLWAEDIYAESGMGCTGPVVMVAEEDEAKAEEVLVENDYI